MAPAICTGDESIVIRKSKFFKIEAVSLKSLISLYKSIIKGYFSQSVCASSF